MTTPLLQISEAKKGMTIFEVSPYNFYSVNNKRSDHWDFKTKKYTPHTKDIYAFCEWTIYACGKKVLKVCDEKGMKKSMGSYAREDGTYGYFVTSKEMAIQLINELRELDSYKTSEFDIIETRFS